MIVAGWADGYRNNTLADVRAAAVPDTAGDRTVGPCVDRHSLPGPNIDLVPEMIRWWDRWLKDEDNGIDREPPIVLFAQRSTRPGATRREMRGAWRYEPTWPAERLRPTTLALADASTDAPTGGGGRRPRGSRRRRMDRVDLVRGQLPWGQPDDQRPDEAFSLTYTWPAARAGPRDPGACAPRGDAHLVGAGRVPLGEALRRLPGRRLVARHPRRC